MKKLTAAALALSLTLMATTGCFSISKEFSGSRFYSENINWGVFSTNTFFWLQNGIGKISAEELISKFGKPVSIVSSKNGISYAWLYQEMKSFKTDFLVLRQNRSETSIEFLTVFLSDGKLTDFNIGQSTTPLKGHVWTSEELVRISAAGAAFFLVGKIVDKAVKEGVNTGTESFTPPSY